MAKIDIRRPHALTLAQAKKHANVMAEHLKQEFDLESTWEGDALHFTRPGVDGTMAVGAEDVHVQAQLGMLVSFLKGRIEASLHQHFDEIFGPADEVAGKRAAARKAPAKKAAAKTKR